MRTRGTKAAGGSSTAAVLWLMITLVFVPIIALHAVAVLVLSDPAEAAGAP